jgi:hypothetical protein
VSSARNFSRGPVTFPRYRRRLTVYVKQLSCPDGSCLHCLCVIHPCFSFNAFSKLTRHTRDSLTCSRSTARAQPTSHFLRFQEICGDILLCVRHCGSHLIPPIHSFRLPHSPGVLDIIVLYRVASRFFHPPGPLVLFLQSFLPETSHQAVDHVRNTTKNASQQVLH